MSSVVRRTGRAFAPSVGHDPSWAGFSPRTRQVIPPPARVAPHLGHSFGGVRVADGPAVALKQDDSSWSQTLGQAAGGLGPALSAAGQITNNPLLGLTGSGLSAAGGENRMLTSDSLSGKLSGGAKLASGGLGMARWLGRMPGLGPWASGAAALGSGIDAVSDFSSGNIWSGIGDSVKGLGQAGMGLAQAGGFSLAGSGALSMPAGAALMGGGGTGLAALGPAAAVIGSGAAGWEIGKLLDKSVGWAGSAVGGDKRTFSDRVVDRSFGAKEWVQGTTGSELAGDVVGYGSMLAQDLALPLTWGYDMFSALRSGK